LPDGSQLLEVRVWLGILDSIIL